jgi:hypothetical protein
VRSFARCYRLFVAGIVSADNDVGRASVDDSRTYPRGASDQFAAFVGHRARRYERDPDRDPDHDHDHDHDPDPDPDHDPDRDINPDHDRDIDPDPDRDIDPDHDRDIDRNFCFALRIYFTTPNDSMLAVWMYSCGQTGCASSHALSVKAPVSYTIFGSCNSTQVSFTPISFPA